MTIVIKLRDSAWFQYGHLNLAWFQYGVSGPIIMQPESVHQMAIITGSDFREQWIGVVAAAIAVAALPP